MLYQERASKSISLEKLSPKIHIKPQVLHAIEKGKSGVNAERAKKISAIFNKPVEYFLYRLTIGFVKKKLYSN